MATLLIEIFDMCVCGGGGWRRGENTFLGRLMMGGYQPLSFQFQVSHNFHN